MIEYIVSPKKSLLLKLKDWITASERVLSDYDTYLSPSAYKILNTLVVELRKNLLEVTE